MNRTLLAVVGIGFCALLPAGTQTRQHPERPESGAPALAQSSQRAKALKVASGEERQDAAQPPVRSVLEEVITEPVFQGKCYVQEAGRNHPYTVVLVHGLGEGAARDWEHVIPVLARQYHILTFDLPGFGRSEKQNALYSPGNYAAFLKWIVDERVNGPFTLVGHSLGGVVSLRFASTYPRNLHHLIMIDTPGILHRSVAFKSAGRLLTDFASEGPAARAFSILNLFGGIDSIWATLLSKVGSVSITPEADTAMAGQFLKGRPEAIAGLAMAEEDFSRRLQFVTQPVTLLWGTEDMVAPIRTAKALVAQMYNARLIPLEGVGHSPMTEKPDQFDELLNQNILAKPVPVPVAAAIVTSDRIGRFKDSPNQTISGAYKLVEIEGCDNFKMESLTAQSLRIKNSTVIIEGSRIIGGQNALTAQDSHINMTGGILDGDVAIIAKASDLDLAGVRLRGNKAIIKTEDWAKFVFSISQASLGDEVWFLQGIEELSPETSPWPK